MQKITPFLWFKEEAEEAVNFYTSIFDNSKITSIDRYGEGAPFPKDTAFIISFELDGNEYMAMNAGPHHDFNDAISLYVDCKDQAELDKIWDGFISSGGQEVQCGWLKDKFGVSWQIVPREVVDMMRDSDAEKASRANTKVMNMVKLDVDEIRKAFDGE